MVVLYELGGQVHAPFVLHCDSLAELVSLLLPFLQALQRHVLLILDLLFFVLLRLLKLLLQFHFFLPCFLLLLLTELGDFVGHLVPLLQLVVRSINLLRKN